MENCRQDFDDVRSKLLASISSCTVFHEQGIKMEEKAINLNSQIDKYEQIRALIVSTINRTIELVKLTEVYLEVKERESKKSLNSAISNASTLVPGSSASGAKLVVKDKKAWIKTFLTNDVAEQEGSGYRSTLSILMRYAMVQAKHNTFKMILVDEGLGPLSDETVENFKEFLRVFKLDSLIIGIEQRSYTYNGIADDVYEFTKSEGVTKVKKIT